MSNCDVPRKLSIFLSSSFRDLKDIRQELVMEILRSGHIPNGMEMFHAGNTRNLAVIRNAITECDIFVLLVGARRGEIVDSGKKEAAEGDKKEIAYVEWEYELALLLGKPIIVYLLNQDEYNDVRNKLPKDDPERRNDQLLDEFRTKVQQAPDGEGKRIVEFFSYQNIGDLRAKLSSAIKPEYAAVSGGWVPGLLYDNMLERVQFDASVSSNPFFQRFAERLNGFKKLTGRTSDRNHLKSAIARHFWKLYLSKIALSERSRLFFESGSSIAYVSEDFIRRVGEAQWGRDLSKRLRIATNNILTFFDFALIAPGGNRYDVSLEPKGPFEQSYGATYGELAEAVELSHPQILESLHPNAQPYVDAVIAGLRKFFDAPGMILMTASGVELDENSPFPGPHVGSYYNKLVKRALLEVRVPTVLFLDQAKFPYPFQVGKCHSVCGPDFKWQNIRKDIPLAVALAFDKREDRITAVDRLKSIGFKSDEPEVEDGGKWPLIAVNQEFKKAMP